MDIVANEQQVTFVQRIEEGRRDAPGGDLHVDSEFGAQRARIDIESFGSDNQQAPYAGTGERANGSVTHRAASHLNGSDVIGAGRFFIEYQDCLANHFHSFAIGSSIFC